MNHRPARCVVAISLCLTLAACDAQPDARLLIQPSEPLARDCLENFPGHLTQRVPVAEVRKARPHKGIEYEVRGRDSSISVFQDFDLNAIELALTSEGSSSAEQKGGNLALLKDVHHGVLSACNLDPAKVRIDRSCTGDTCKDPSYPDL